MDILETVVISFITSSITTGLNFYASKTREKNNRNIEKDKELLNKFIEKFPIDGIVPNLSNSSPLPGKYIDELEEMESFLSSASSHFMNKTIEEQKKELLIALKQFYSVELFPHKSNNREYVLKHYGEFDEEDGNHFDKEYKVLIQIVKQIREKYAQFIEIARKKL